MSTTMWPAVEWEHQTWRSTAAWGAHADVHGGLIDYRSAIPPFIATAAVELDLDVQQRVRTAETELARLDAELGSRVATFAPVLLRSEAASSSQIENLTASARSIFSAELGIKGSRNAELIAANTRSLQAAIDLADDPSADAILAMHKALMKDQPRHAPGQWREEAVWIGTRSDTPANAEFVAPHHTRVPGLIDDLVAFTLRQDLTPLVLMAIAHAQFETIHPFTDGNGRTGRALAQAMLRRAGLTRNLAVPVSAGLLADVEGYHGALTAYRAGDVAPIVRAFADAIARAELNTRQLVAELDQIRTSWEDRLTVRRRSNAWRLLDVVIRRPVLSAAVAAEELEVAPPNVYPPLNALVEAGILRSKHEHRMGPFWRADEVLAAIDAFAVRAGRRDIP